MSAVSSPTSARPVAASTSQPKQPAKLSGSSSGSDSESTVQPYSSVTDSGMKSMMTAQSVQPTPVVAEEKDAVLQTAPAVVEPKTTSTPLQQPPKSVPTAPPKPAFVAAKPEQSSVKRPPPKQDTEEEERLQRRLPSTTTETSTGTVYKPASKTPVEPPKALVTTIAITEEITVESPHSKKVVEEGSDEGFIQIEATPLTGNKLVVPTDVEKETEKAAAAQRRRQAGIVIGSLTAVLAVVGSIVAGVQYREQIKSGTLNFFQKTVSNTWARIATWFKNLFHRV